MGIDKGFDLYPPLENTDVDSQKCAAFLAEVTSYYEERKDPNSTINNSRDIVITQGEHPTLRHKVYQSRRFSSKYTGSHAENVTNYLELSKESWGSGGALGRMLQ
ncbi:hypothetical protein B0H17DRAFT_1151053 [Mycena rosella]|uniref:Uncharacterized protein n=1 Tax=Mycena rosella TaxID=1033263 RepID=A0AAD7BNQ8_MYCRO|nr:hypothetical protein B0H17DRAFT_1153224 [Mycena rosella]KAJ7626447.1 hypothetical protein B0H17DRAFT_1151053 [Mycena rosella]